jgi:hypothetical protein
METKPKIILAKGSHDPEPGTDLSTCPRCMFEAYNWAKRAKFTDACPPGVSVVLYTFGIRLNDVLPDDTRQALVRYLPNGTDPLDGTAGDGRDETRSYMALDWLIRTYLLRFLELSPRLADHAAAVRALPRICDMDSASTAGLVVRAAGAAAGDAAWAAARDAARAAAGDAAWAAAGAAAWDAARAAAWAAAGDAAWAAAVDTAWDAAWAAARDAARAAAGDAAGDAAGTAACKVLNPVVVILQESALALYDQMIKGTWDEVSG